MARASAQMSRVIGGEPRCQAGPGTSACHLSQFCFVQKQFEVSLIHNLYVQRTRLMGVR